MHRVIQRYIDEIIGLSVAGTKHVPVRLIGADESIVTISRRGCTGQDVITHIALSQIVSTSEGIDFRIANNVAVRLVIEVFPPVVGGGGGLGIGIIVPT